MKIVSTAHKRMHAAHIASVKKIHDEALADLETRKPLVYEAREIKGDEPRKVGSVNGVDIIAMPGDFEVTAPNGDKFVIGAADIGPGSAWELVEVS